MKIVWNVFKFVFKLALGIALFVFSILLDTTPN